MEMENLTTQVGQKMRSAVKAKLIELGTGGAAGYIDDELPDYVMIMVANKRSKQQMISDLNLFLGTHTELFVTWLHEVLQKLQEVTLPTSVIQKGKRKLSESEPNVNVKKEKKEKKKKKKPSEKPTEPASISEVFANHLLEKTKKTIQVETKAKKETPIEKNSTDEFDIPTITEISEQNTVQTNREKDLSELAELQKKINQAKRQLRGLESDESEDEDFLNIKEDGEEFDEIVADKTAKKNKEGTPPAVEDQKPSEDSKENENASLLEKQRKHTPIVYSPPKQQNDSHVKKKPIYERLGYKTNKSTNDGGNFAPARRLDKELYVPTFRRKEPELESRSKNRENKKSIDSSEDDRNKSGKSNVRRRIGSRVIVAPPKPESKDEDENCVDRSINSLIKIKPRPPVSPSKQASKNLLLRAVAEAQKSTALIKPKKDFTILPSPTSPYSRIQKLYSKSYRDRNRKTVLKKVAKDNIVIEVNAEKTPLSGLQKFDEDEYIPEPISDRGDSDSEFIYIPQTINSIEEDTECENRAREIDATKNRTPQFVVTLDDKIREKYISKSKTRISGKNSTAIEIKIVPDENLENLLPSTPKSPGKKHHKKPIEVYRKAKEIKKIIIKNDTDDEESVGSSKEKDKIADGSLTPPLPKPDTPMKRKRSAVSPIKFDLSDEKEARKLKSGEREESKDDLDKDDERVKVLTKKAETSKKYENIPELLSAVSLDSSVKPKTKERCKYFPTCGKGDSCEFYHPTLPCKVFPNCKFADKCLYVHPKCKFDLTCNRIGCNFSHSAAQIASVAPPLSSHVVPVQNYKSITATPLPAMCKYYPNCTNSVCNFYHPKLCRFGKNCMNKIECNFYHHDLPNKDKFKWVASLG